MINGFVDNNTDNKLVDYLQPAHKLLKSMNKSGLVQKEVIVNGKNGPYRAMKWVRPDGDTQPEPTTQAADVPKEKKKKREQRPATPHNITEKTKHLKPIEEFDEIPEHIKNLDKPIPPSWRNVMISPDPDADVLAIGKDDMDRPQYIYNPKVVQENQEKKFQRVHALIANRDKLEQVIKTMEDRETADCLDLIFHMGIRPGSTRDTKAAVEALGATTLRGENVTIEPDGVHLRFTGKKGVYQDHIVPDSKLSAMLVQRKQNVAGTEDLFGTTAVKLRKALEPLGIHPKDLRTMLATSTAQNILSGIEPTTDPKEVAKVRNQVGDAVCALLGNRRTMALKSYIDPSVFEEWSPEGFKAWQEKSSNKQSKEAEDE